MVLVMLCCDIPFVAGQRRENERLLRLQPRPPRPPSPPYFHPLGLPRLAPPRFL